MGATNERATVYGDNAYGTGAFQERLEEDGIESRCKTQSPTAAGGLFAKDRFDVDVAEGTVTCANGVARGDQPSSQRGRDGLLQGCLHHLRACAPAVHEQQPG